MSADLHIHVMTDELTEQDIERFFSNTLDSKHFGKHGLHAEKPYGKIGRTPSVWIGSVSWLKAALFDDADAFVPDTVQAVKDIIGEDLPVLDDELIDRLMGAFASENRTGYPLAKEHDVLAFLEEHKGKRLFTVSW